MTTASQLSENSHQGFDGIKAALCLESMEAKSNTASGMPVCLWREGIGSRSSGKERDAETGLDYFEARYFSGAQGRFLSVDPENAGAKHEDPQSWNAYAYARNNPLKYTDPDGLMYRLCTPSGSCIDNYSDSDFYWNFQSNPSIYLSGSGNIFADGQYIGYFVHLSDDPWYVDLKNDASNLMRYGSEEIQRKKEESWDQKNYAGWLIANAADFIWPGDETDVALAMAPIGKIGKTAKKANAKRVESAKAIIDELRKKIRELKSIPNTTPQIKQEINRLLGQLKKQLTRMKKSEEHARKAQ